eukprot:1316751-Amorphochlora_amoeboformis.AAC.1
MVWGQLVGLRVGVAWVWIRMRVDNRVLVRVGVRVEVEVRMRDEIIQHVLVRGPLTPLQSGAIVLLGITADSVVGFKLELNDWGWFGVV